MSLVVAKLIEIGVPADLAHQVPELPNGASGLLVYGSRARGDAIDTSDLDLLALVEEPRHSILINDVSLSFYTRSQLASGIGTLFGSHLSRDSKTLWDPHGTLEEVIQRMGAVDTARLFERAKTMSTLLTTPEQDLPKYLPGLLRQARYLLRSCLYADAIRRGRPCFSVREIAIRHADPDLVELLASRQPREPDRSQLDDCIRRLQRLIGDFPPSRHGSLEATVVNEWGVRGDLLSGAFLALGSTGTGSMYAEVEKILL